MIPQHPRFLEAINEKNKVNLRFYSIADSGVLDRVCAPLDYGLGRDNKDGLNRYWVWDDSASGSSRLLGLLPQQILDVQILGVVFDPAAFGDLPQPWSVPRNWGAAVT
jgi:hypothetical protein